LDREPQSIASLETAFVGALNSIQNRYPTAGLTEDDLWDIVRDEERRVADALIVAELLLPQLQSFLNQRPVAPVSSAPVAAPTVAPVVDMHEPRVETRVRPPPVSPPGIADLIDGMLDQQRNERRPRRS
jgi:hypothetical protein